LLVAPPVTPLTENSVVAAVPVLVLTDAGAVPASVKPEVDAATYVNVASAVGLISPVADLSKEISPPGPAQVPAPPRNVLLEQLPPHSPYTSAAAAFDNAPVVVVFLIMPVPNVAQF
jgi:hypothetical protein